MTTPIHYITVHCDDCGADDEFRTDDHTVVVGDDWDSACAECGKWETLTVTHVGEDIEGVVMG